MLFGEELEWPFFDSVSMVMARFATKTGRGGCLGVVGPVRLDYSRVVPNVRYFANLANELMNQF